MDFWLQHGEALLKSASYPEIAPRLVLMAFLHRVVNGGGTLDREYAIRRDRMDLSRCSSFSNWESSAIDGEPQNTQSNQRMPLVGAHCMCPTNGIMGIYINLLIFVVAAMFIENLWG